MVTALYQTFILGGHIKRELVLCEGGSCCLRREWLKNHISQLHKSRLQNSQVLMYWLVASYSSNIYWATKEHCGASQRAFVVKKKKKKTEKTKPACQSKVRNSPQRRKWQPAPLFLPGKFHGQRSLVGYSPWGHRDGHHWATEQRAL